MEMVLLWCFVLAWMAKRGAEDLVHAVKGTPNPRYELKKAKAAQTGRPVDGQPRYGTREWFADLYSDALAAHTERRRKAAAARAQPVDDMVDVVRERPVPQQRRPEPEWLTPDRDELDEPTSVVHDDQHPYCLEPCGPTCGRFGWLCGSCGTEKKHFVTRREAEESHRQHVCPPTPDDRPLAAVIDLFPNAKLIEKEITMANSEVTGLSTAAAFAEQAAAAHQAFTTAGTEGYVGALEQMGFGPGVIGLAGEAREASANASAKWTALKDAMDEFVGGREFYQSNPDAPEKAALVNE